MAVGNYEIYHDEIQELVAGVPFGTLLKIAIQCAERVVPTWEAYAPDDPAIGNALKAVSKLRDGLTSKMEVLMWKRILRECGDQASDVYIEANKLSNTSQLSPDGVIAYKADWSISAVSSLVMLATVDEQTEDVEDLQKERESLFAEVLAFSWEASDCDADERRWQLETIKKRTNRDISERVEKRTNELDSYSHRGDFLFFSGMFRHQLVVVE